jgi:cytochrome c oxidase assembly protein subunit 11
VDIHRKFTLSFKAEIDPKANWDFDAVQREVVVNSGETALVFYRAYNKEDKPIIGTIASFFIISRVFNVLSLSRRCIIIFF